MLPFKNELLPGALDGYELPISDGSERNRKNIRKAAQILADAGWQVDDAGVLRNAAGDIFRFEILSVQGAHETQSIASIYIEALKRLGIDARLTIIDSAQYKERTTAYDFDMAWYQRNMSLSPGNEQKLYWGSDGVQVQGSRNWMGMASPAAERMIEEMLMAEDQDDFVAAVRALDPDPDFRQVRHSFMVLELLASGAQCPPEIPVQTTDLWRLDRLPA